MFLTYVVTLTGYPGWDAGFLSDLALSPAGRLVGITYAGDTLVNFDISGAAPVAGGSQSLVQSETPLGGGARLDYVDLGGSEALILGGFSGGALPVYSVASDGTVSSTWAGALSDALRVSDVVDLGGKLLLADGISGTLTVYDSSSGAAALDSMAPMPPGGGVEQLALITADGTDRIVGISAASGLIAAWAQAPNGTIYLTDTVAPAENPGIATPTAVAAVELLGRSFVIVAGSESSSISVFELTAAGALAPCDHVFDDLTTRFARITELEVVRAGDRVFVLATGSDDGLSLFTLMPDGRLYHEDSIADTAGTALGNVSALAATVAGGELRVFTTSGIDPGVSMFGVDVTGLGVVLRAAEGGGLLTGSGGRDVLTGGDGADSLNGGAGDDLLSDGPGADTLTGGAGADVFILGPDGATDRITDFDPAIDRLDLSAFPLFHDAAQLVVVTTGWGAQISYRGEVTEVYSANGLPLCSADFAGLTLTNLSRAQLPGGTPAQLMIGSDGDDTLIGGPGDDSLAGGPGADVLAGGGDLILRSMPRRRRA